MATPLEQAIETAATDGIEEVEGEAGRVKRAPLPDRIAADQYVKATSASAKAHRGIRFSRLIPPGTVGGE